MVSLFLVLDLFKDKLFLVIKGLDLPIFMGCDELKMSEPKFEEALLCLLVRFNSFILRLLLKPRALLTRPLLPTVVELSKIFNPLGLLLLFLGDKLSYLSRLLIESSFVSN